MKMICPQCKAEYRDGFYVCSDCKISLVADLPKEKQADEPNMDFVEIASVPDFTQLSLVKMMFETENIRYFLRGEQMIGVGIARGGGPAGLFVATDDKDRAIELLESLESEE